MNRRFAFMLLIVSFCQFITSAEEIMTQEFTSNKESDWQPIIPSVKSSVECYSVSNDCWFKLDDVAQSANGKYLILYPEGKITLPCLEGKVSKIEIRLYEDQPFSSLCNLIINNQDGNRERYLEVDARNPDDIDTYVAFPYDLSIVYPEDDSIFTISSKKKIYLTGIRITYTPDSLQPIVAPTFSFPEWISDNNHFSQPFWLTISTSTEDAEILYSRDSSSWSHYDSAINITESCTIHAKAIKNGRESNISSISFTKFENKVADIDELLEIGQYALSELDDNNQLSANPNGYFIINRTLQIIAHNGNRIFVSDNTDNFHNCITLISSTTNENIADGAIIESPVEGYFVMIDNITPALYVNDKIEPHSYSPTFSNLRDIIDNPNIYLNKYVLFKEVNFDYSQLRLTLNDILNLPIINIFDIDIPNETLVNIEGIIIYDKLTDSIGIAPLTIDNYTDISKIKTREYSLHDISMLPDDAMIYDLNGLRISHTDIISGIYIIHYPGHNPHKIFITD